MDNIFWLLFYWKTNRNNMDFSCNLYLHNIYFNNVWLYKTAFQKNVIPKLQFVKYYYQKIASTPSPNGAEISS